MAGYRNPTPTVDVIIERAFDPRDILADYEIYRRTGRHPAPDR